MMQRFLVLGLAFGSAFLLSGCIDRDEANAKLAAGCEAAAGHMTHAPFKVSAVKNVRFDEVSFGADTGLRQVSMDVTETDGWLKREKPFKCVFTEFLGFFNMSHKADLYRIEVGRVVLGKGEGASSEKLDEWLEVREAANKGVKDAR